MSRLHVCVDCMIFPLGSVILIGFVVIFLFTTGAPATRKCPVAPESEMACWTALVVLGSSTMVEACGNWATLVACMILVAAVALVCLGMHVGIFLMWIGVCGLALSSSDKLSSSLEFSVAAVPAWDFPSSVQFDMTTMTSSSSSMSRAAK